jgi:hypothetical protein
LVLWLSPEKQQDWPLKKPANGELDSLNVEAEIVEI